MSRINKANEYMAHIKPIRKSTLEAIRKETSKYIFVEKDGNAYCEKCNAEFTLLGSKHKASAKCPNCKGNFEVWHTSRKSEHHNYEFSWRVIADAIDSTTLALRYVLVGREGRKVVELDEKAIEIIDFKNRKNTYFENKFREGWKKGTFNFFRVHNMGYGTRKLCCREAKIYNTKWFNREVSKLDCFKYIDISEFHKNGFYISSVMEHISKKASLVEKLQKVGMSDLVISDLHTYQKRDEIQFNNSETELHKMLGITKANMTMLKESKLTLANLRRLQDNNSISPMEYADLQCYSTYEEEIIRNCSKLIGSTVHKVCKYVKEQGIGVYEYENYLDDLKTCDYSLKDLSYSLPKDFHKEVDRIDAEIVEARKRKEEERKQFEMAKDSILAEIKRNIESNKELKEYCDGSKRYMCHIPGSVEDFVNEGKNNHNCVGGKHYTDAVAKKETFVFFIREADNPTASFVTCECVEGQIVQIMFDKNKRVEHDTEIYSFAEAFARRLSAINKVA